MTRVNATTFQATVTIKTGGPAGTIRFKVQASDTGGGFNYANRSYPLH